MAIEKNSFKVARFDPELHSPNSRDVRDVIMSSDEDDGVQRQTAGPAVESNEEEEVENDFDDCDSGAASDDFDLLELGESGEEFCQIGDQTCSLPYELYDRPGLEDVLSMEVWNDVLTEEDRFCLSKYLPDMDQENYVCTLKELFSGENFNFGTPVSTLFKMLKGGMCEPRVALYRQGFSFFQRKQHYHNLRKHHNTMVNNLCQIRDAWLNCKGYSIDEKLRVLNIVMNQKSLMNENLEEFVSESSEKEESGDGLWGKRPKDRKLGQKTGRNSAYLMNPALDISSRGRKSNIATSVKHGKQNPRGNLKLGGSMKEVDQHFPLTFTNVPMKSRRYGLELPVSLNHHDSDFGSSAAFKMNDQILEDNESESTFGTTLQRDGDRLHLGAREPEDKNSFLGFPVSLKNSAFNRNNTINTFSDIMELRAKPSILKNMSGGGKKAKYSEIVQHSDSGNQMKLFKGQKSKSPSKGSHTNLLDATDQGWVNKRADLFDPDVPGNFNELNAKKKWNIGQEATDAHVKDKVLRTDYKAKSLKDKFGTSVLQNGRTDGVRNRGVGTFLRYKDTESDSSGHVDADKDEENNPLMRSKLAYPGGVPELIHGPDAENSKHFKGEKKENYLIANGSSHLFGKMRNHNETPEAIKSEQRGKMHDGSYFNTFPIKAFGEDYFPGQGNVMSADDKRQFYVMGTNGHGDGSHGDGFHIPSQKSAPNLGRRRKGEVARDFSLPQSSHMHENFRDDLFSAQLLVSDNTVPFNLGKRGQMVELIDGNHIEVPELALMGCNTQVMKKRKLKDDLAHMDLQGKSCCHADANLQLDDASPSMKWGKNNLDDASDTLENGTSQTPAIEVEDIEIETKPQKKSFPLITPSAPNCFSFSIIHLLSAVRMAMITPLPDGSDAGKHHNKNGAEEGVKEEQVSKPDETNANSDSNMDVDSSVPSAQAKVPSLTVQEIINRVTSNPGDPCILETQEPLQDLIRGVLKIFSLRTAPLGAKGWKPLVAYQKSKKSWSWTGSVSNYLSEFESVEEMTSPDAWGLPHKMLVKLVDSFANWLKNSQETLKQMGTLPSPPVTLMQINLDEKERFKDLRAQKSLNTISPSSEEVKVYFRKEEELRYQIPDRAFSYTTVDGKKSIVAPLRRCGGKPTSKARDHFMLKRDRPPHVTILCLVRDAASRLPGSIGTRADVCTVIRDSQYIVEDVSDTQVNQVVSGALDRLHYERDPCVQFDSDRKLWVYLHREREEEDFEDDGTSSTKKWRRQKKESIEPSEPGDVTVAYPGPVGKSGHELVSDLNAEALCADDDKRSEHDYQNGNDHLEDTAENGHSSDHSMKLCPTPLTWNGPRFRSSENNKLLCQENSTNEDFDEDAFGEPPS